MNSSTVSNEEVVQIAIASIRRDGGTQPRAMLDRPTISEYAFELEGGAIFPPVVVFYDGTDYWLADGYHRVEAAESIKKTQIAATLKQGTLRDAVLYSVGVNATHGLRRTSADKRRAVMTLLSDAEWGQWSAREIARRCGVHHQMVGKIRSSLDESSSERIYMTKHGTTASMKTTNIGKLKKEEYIVELQESEDTIAPDNQVNNASDELLVQGDRVFVKESNSLLARQVGIVTALPNPSSAVVELDGGGRELIYRRDLEKPYEAIPVQKTQTEPRNRREGINYQPNGASEYYVRVSKDLWERLEEYQQIVGAATMAGAIERLLTEARF